MGAATVTLLLLSTISLPPTTSLAAVIAGCALLALFALRPARVPAVAPA
jgi:hypothetical protein